MKYHIQFHSDTPIAQIRADMVQAFGCQVDIELDGKVLTVETIDPISTETVKNVQEYTGAVSYVPRAETTSPEAGFIFPQAAGIIALIIGLIYVMFKKLRK